MRNRMMNHRNLARALASSWLLVILATSLSTQVVAQENNPTEAPRELGGHLFIPSTIVPDPFVSTTVSSTTGFGMAVNLDVPILNLDGEQVGSLSGNIGVILLEFKYQHAINRRFAVRGGISGGSRVGTTAISILSEGVSAIYGYEVGGTASLMRKRNWQLSATVDVRGNTLYGVSPLDFVRAVVHSIADGDSTDAVEAGADSLLSQGSNVRVLGGVRAAYTPAQWIGFIGYVEAGMGDKFFESESNTSVVNGGAAVSFDLNPLTHTPMGFLGTYRGESLSERGEDLGAGSQAFGFGIFYTGRPFFSIGLENTWQRIDQPTTEQDIDAVQGRIVLRYDFN